jgi:haloalkane dehalogenase
VIARGCWRPLRQPVIDAYDAPFPEDDLTSGPRALPQLAPAAPDEPTGLANRRTWGVLETWTRPFRTCFGDSDPILQGGDRTLQARIPGARGQRHITLERAGHWLMEDAGDELADLVVDYVAETG